MAVRLVALVACLASRAPLAPLPPTGSPPTPGVVLCAACAPWVVAAPVRHAARPHNRTATANALPATPHGRACMPKARVCRGGAGLIVRPAHGAALFRRVQTASAAGARAATDAIHEMRHTHLHHRSQRRRNHLIAPGLPPRLPPPPPPPPQHTCADLAHCVNSAAATDGEAPCLSRGCGCTGDASANPSVVYGRFPLGGTACGWCLPSGRSLNHGEATATCAKQCPHLKYFWPRAGRGRQLGVWTGRHCSGRARPATGSTPHPPKAQRRGRQWLLPVCHKDSATAGATGASKVQWYADGSATSTGYHHRYRCDASHHQVHTTWTDGKPVRKSVRECQPDVGCPGGNTSHMSMHEDLPVILSAATRALHGASVWPVHHAITERRGWW